MIKRFLFILALAALCAGPLHAQVTNVEVRVTFTNVVNGVTNGDTLTISGDVRRYTNGVLDAAATWIQSTNIVGHAATNTQLHLSSYLPTGIDRVFTTNTNALIIVSANGVFPTVTLSSGVGTVSYATNIWAEQDVLRHPNQSGYNETDRTNNASGLIGLINDVRPTNQVANGNVGWTNILDLTSFQRASNKTLYATTNNGGLSDGQRITNFTGLHGSNGTVSDLHILRGALLNATNVSGTNMNFTNVTLRHVQFIDANPRGTNVGFTNGYTLNVTNVNPVTSNLVNYGEAIRSSGPGGNSFQAGSNAVVYGELSVGVGNSVVVSNNNTVTLGTGAQGLAPNSVILGVNAIGLSNLTAGGSLNVMGNNARATGSVLNLIAPNSFLRGINSTAVGYDLYLYDWNNSILIGNDFLGGAVTNFVGLGPQLGGLANQALALGYRAGAAHEHSFALGPADTTDTGVTTTTTNQGVLGTPLTRIYIPGVLSAAGVSNLMTLPDSTNVIKGDVSFPRATISTIANGANRLNMGTNVSLDLVGSPSATWSVDGIIFGVVTPRDGHNIYLRNGTGYDATFAHNSGLEVTAAYRLSTATSTNVIFTNGATAHLIYSGASARWILWNVFSGHPLTASATNAMGFIDGSGTNASFYQTAASAAVTINPLIGAGGPRLAIKDTNGATVVSVDTNNLLVASNAAFKGVLTSWTATQLTNLTGFGAGTNNGDFHTHDLFAGDLNSDGFGGGFALVSDGTTVAESAVTEAELVHLSGVTSALQAQIDARIASAAAMTNRTATNWIGIRHVSAKLPSTNMAVIDQSSALLSRVVFYQTNGAGAVIETGVTYDGLFLPTDAATNTVKVHIASELLGPTGTNGPNASNLFFRVTAFRDNTVGGNVSTNDSVVGPFDGATASVMTVPWAASHTVSNKAQTVSVTLTNFAVAGGEPFALKVERLSTSTLVVPTAIRALKLEYTR